MSFSALPEPQLGAGPCVRAHEGEIPGRQPLALLYNWGGGVVRGLRIGLKSGETVARSRSARRVRLQPGREVLRIGRGRGGGVRTRMLAPAHGQDPEQIVRRRSRRAYMDDVVLCQPISGGEN
jgi:hypothetical protein